MDPNVHPGACWPLNGDKGHVTLRLAQPIRFESITIDHSLLSTTKFTNSAPRYFEIVGYPPSSTDSWGLDMTKGKVLSSFEFDPSQKSSSTFFKTPELPKEGSCTEVKPSCDAPMTFSSGSNSSDDDFFIAGIMIRITGNWGNPDYTCLYHVRLHGSLV
jgi:Sad1 / UNC-like C-terminal